MFCSLTKLILFFMHPTLSGLMFAAKLIVSVYTLVSSTSLGDRCVWLVGHIRVEHGQMGRIRIEYPAEYYLRFF